MQVRKRKGRGFEGVWSCEDKTSFLKAFIAVHDTSLGPALGGIRMWPFKTASAALEDCLRLARAMTYKAAVSGLKLGGGKAVIVGDPFVDKSDSLFLAMGEFINLLRGKYLAAEDSGILPGDLDLVRQRTRFVTGASHQQGGSGDPSPATAKGVYLGIKAAVKETFGDENLKGITCAIQGAGQVGSNLAALLHQDGCHLIVSEMVPERQQIMKEKFGARVVDPDEIYSTKAEIFSPCALGGTVNDRTIRQLKAKIIAGGANNQLANESRHSQALFRRGILHAPDFVVNAGGLIQLYVLEILREKDVNPWLDRVYETLIHIFGESKRNRRTPLAIAYEMARDQLRMARLQKSKSQDARRV